MTAKGALSCSLQRLIKPLRRCKYEIARKFAEDSEHNSYTFESFQFDQVKNSQEQ